MLAKNYSAFLHEVEKIFVPLRRWSAGIHPRCNKGWPARLFFLFVLLIAAAQNVFAGDSGRIQLAIASPDPTLAGEKITFQVIAVNSGSEIWAKKNYYIEVEIYDIEKRYMLKSDPLRGKVDIKPSSNILAYLPVIIPDYYSGLYFFRVFLTNGKTRLAKTDYIPFNINPLPITPPKVPKIKVGGNVAVSYETDDGNDWKDFNANISMNLIGRILDRSFLFNLYTISDQDDTLDIYTVLFNFYGTYMTMNLGDIQPEYSNLSLYGAGMRGGQLQYSYKRYHTDVVAARTADSEEGTEESDGVYRRMLYGIKQSVDLPFGVAAAANYVRSSDAEGSVDIPGPTILPEENSVAGGSVVWQIIKGVKLTGDMQSSSYFENTKSSRPAVTDTAYRVDLNLEHEIFLFDAYYETVNPEFYSFGAPSVDSDRQTIDASGEINLFNFMNLSGGINQYHNNLENTEEYTTSQNTTNGGVVFTFPWNGGFSTSYSNSHAYGDNRSLLDNSSLSMTYGINQSFLGQSMSIYFQNTEFEDKTGSSSNLETATTGGSVNLNYKNRATVSLGVTMSEIKDVVAKSKENTNSYSVSLNTIILQDKLTSQLWGYLNTDSDDIKTVDTSENKISMEFTYQVDPKLAFTLGVSQFEYTDEINPANDNTETGVNIRATYSF